MRLFALIVLLTGAATTTAQQPTEPAGDSPYSARTFSVLYHQTAAEYRALCYQAFNLATLRLQAIPDHELKRGKPAIITDIDETILDNSFCEAKLILDRAEYSSETWKAWTSLKSAPALPGAVEFLKDAHRRGITIFYVSNRDTGEVQWTVENLQNLGIPDADPGHMLFMSNTSSKETRREEIMKEYDVIMLLGDNLNDFTIDFEKRSIADRLNETDRAREEWGRKFIVFPNCIYGEWEKALYNYGKHLTPLQKDSIRTSLLKGF